MIKRSTWVSALKAVPTNDLLELINELTEGWILRAKSVPQSGLGMMQLKDSAFNEAFYLGEFPLASSWLEVTTTDGQKAEGAAQVMDDRIEVAEALALCDAILSSKLSGWERIYLMVERGIVINEKIKNERKTILARTRVNFSLLDNVEHQNVST